MQNRFRWLRRLLPALMSAGLLYGFIGYRISPEKLASAASKLDWPQLSLATAGLVLALYFWDALCLQWLFSRSTSKLSYRAALRARGNSYPISALNYELGQGILTWQLARVQGIDLVVGLGLCGLLAYHDFVVLLGFGLTGSLIATDARTRFALWICACGLPVLVGLAVVPKLFPNRVRRFRENPRWSIWLTSWNWGQSLRLLGLRTAYYGIMLLYAVAAFQICAISLDFRVICSLIPLVLFVVGLPIGISGLGTRENVLVYLVDPPDEQDKAVLAALGLVWSAGLIIGRMALGLFHWWVVPALSRMWATKGEDEPSA